MVFVNIEKILTKIVVIINKKQICKNLKYKIEHKNSFWNSQIFCLYNFASLNFAFLNFASQSFASLNFSSLNFTWIKSEKNNDDHLDASNK